MYILLQYTELAMPKEYETRIFKSGNSAAMRLPKALGFKDGEEVKIVQHADGSFSFWKESEGLRVLMSLYGAFSPGFMSEGRGDIEQDPRDWSFGSATEQAA
jgi:antitoxin VapB